MKHSFVVCLLISTIAFLGLAGCATPPERPQSAVDSPGGRLFLQHCAACHGQQAQGNLGPPLDATGHAHHHTDSELVGVITNGLQRPGAPAEMPAWGNKLSQQEIRQLVTFIKSLWTEDQRQFQSVLPETSELPVSPLAFTRTRNSYRCCEESR